MRDLKSEERSPVPSYQLPKPKPLVERKKLAGQYVSIAYFWNHLTVLQDVIDTLDMTGSLYGFRPHHDGPFDAVSSARNRSNAQRPSPMDAFNPRKQPQDGGLKPPSAAANTRGSGLSPRAQATLSAMDTLDLNASSIGGPYSSVKTGR